MTKVKLDKLSADEMFKLLRLPSGHPDNHGYPYTRSELLRECEHRGKQLLQDLGWPASPTAVYWNLHSGNKTTLSKVCVDWRWSGFKTVLWQVEEELNKLTKGEFYGDFAAVGIECSTVTDWRKLLKKYPEVKEKLREAVRLHKGFYEHCLGGGKPIAEVVIDRKGCECEQNIERLSRWLGLDVTQAESVDSLPKQDIYYGVWSLIENYSPTPDLSRVHGQVRLDVFGGS